MPTTSPAATLPASRPSRVVVEAVAPLVDGGAFPAKATVGEPVTVTADVFTDGHDRAAAALRYRAGRNAWREVPWSRSATTASGPRSCPTSSGAGSTRSSGGSTTSARGATAWSSSWPPASTSPSTCRSASGSSTDALDRAKGKDAAALRALRDRLAAGDTRSARAARLRGRAAPRSTATSPTSTDVEPEHEHLDLDALFWRTGVREPVAELRRPMEIEVDPERARFSAWYEFFPRSTLAPATGHGTLLDAIERLDYVAAMGFDVLYLPPVHPIGTTQRKGRNNTTTPTSDDTGSPWAIGAPDGGHTAVHAELGTVDDVAKLAVACPRPGHRAGPRPGVPVHARPPVGHRAPGVVRPPPGRHDPVRREPARRSTRTSTRSTSRATDWQGLWNGAGRRHPLLDRHRRDDLPRRQPAHQGLRLLGVGDRHDPPRAPRDDLPRRGVHPPAGDGAAGQDRLQPVVHLLHVAPVVVGAAPVLRGPRRAHRRLLPAQRLAEHARHPHRAAADGRPDDVRHPSRSSPPRCRRRGACTARRSS